MPTTCLVECPSVHSAFSGNAAICLPSLPTPAISLPTSALFSVLNFNVVPDTGSYAFTSRVALGTRGASSPVFSSVSAAVRFLFLLAYFSVSRFGMWYFVVIRACVVGKNHTISVAVQRACGELWTYAPWPGALGTAAWLVAAIPPWCRGTPSLCMLWSCCCGISTRCCNRTRTGIAFSLTPRRFAGPIEGMKSGLGAWERVDHAFSLVREDHEVTAIVRAIHPASRDSLLHSATYVSLASRERPQPSSPKVLLSTVIREIYIATLWPDSYSAKRLTSTGVP